MEWCKVDAYFLKLPHQPQLGSTHNLFSIVTGSKKLKRRLRTTTAVPNPKKTKKVERKDVLQLNYWNMWWQRMEREGSKEGNERRMQEASPLFLP
jgi:hypothetical protein